MKHTLLILTATASFACAAPLASLHECVAAHDTARLQEILNEKKGGLNDRDEAGNTALHLAAKAGENEMCRLLLQAGADANACDADGNLPAEVALNDATAAVCTVPANPGFKLYELNKSADREATYRHRVFHAYLPGEEVKARYKTDAYTPYCNPTGIYVKAGDTLQVSVNGAFGHPLTLKVNDVHTEKEADEYPLRSGNNEIRVENAGLVYVDYRDVNPTPGITVDIKGGTVNGIISLWDAAQDADAVLESATAEVLDFYGERVQLVLPVAELRQHCPKGKLVQLLQTYEKVIRLQQELMGWDSLDKNNDHRLPIYGRVTWNGYMYADEEGAGFHVGNMENLCNPDKLKGDSLWGVAHEFGHLNQVRPGMCWQGMTEVTNNLYSLCCQQEMDADNLRMDREICMNADEEPMRGGHMDAFVNCAVVRGEIWQFQHHGASPHPYVSGDVFATLAPFWQLKLYTDTISHTYRPDGEKLLFYPTLFQAVRDTDESKMTNGELRMLFLKRVCDAARLDLTDYFEQCGMMLPLSRGLYDYGDGWITVTDEMLHEVRAYVRGKNYPKPDSSVICYITTDTAEIYRDRLPAHSPKPAELKEQGFQLTVKDGRMEMPDALCGHAVAYECRDSEGNLLRVSLRSLNHLPKDGFTTIIVPENTAIIEAVQWNGQRYTVKELKSAK